MDKKNKRIKDYLDSKMGRSYVFGLILLILFLLIQRYLPVSLKLIYVGILSVILVIIVVETLVHNKEKIKRFTKNIDMNRKPKIFEMGFFFFLFIATLAASFAAAGYYVTGVVLDVFYNFWYFSVFYGFAFGCGYYHYIKRIDE